ncbi:hypothetical protein [Amycolatopsis sp. NPDC003731]
MNSSSTGTTNSADLFDFLKWVMSSRARSKDMRKLLCVAGGIVAILVGVLVVGLAVSGLASAAAGVLCGAVGHRFRGRRPSGRDDVTPRAGTGEA